MLQVVDTLHIESVFLEKEPKLVRTVKVYAKNRANMPSVQDLAKRILDKWSRMVFGISTSYYEMARGADDDEADVSGHDQD